VRFKKTGARLHIFISTAKEMDLLQTKFLWRKTKLPLRFVFITYGLRMTINYKGNLISESSCKNNDRNALWEALLDGRIDVIATECPSIL
jgi:dihydroorotase